MNYGVYRSRERSLLTTGHPKTYLCRPNVKKNKWQDGTAARIRRQRWKRLWEKQSSFCRLLESETSTLEDAQTCTSPSRVGKCRHSPKITVSFSLGLRGRQTATAQR